MDSDPFICETLNSSVRSQMSAELFTPKEILDNY